MKDLEEKKMGDYSVENPGPLFTKKQTVDLIIDDLKKIVNQIDSLEQELHPSNCDKNAAQN